MDSDWQKPVTRKARQIHEQAQENGLGETQPVGGKVIQQNTFDHPDKNHLRTTLRDGSQVETDEIYIGLDKRGVHYALPVQAKEKESAWCRSNRILKCVLSNSPNWIVERSQHK